MTDAADVTERLDALLELLSERAGDVPLLPGEAVETFSIQQLQNISTERFEQLIATVADVPRAQESGAAGRIALRALLADYAAAVRQVRTVVRVSARTLDEVGLSVRAGQRLAQALSDSSSASQEGEVRRS